MALSTRQQQQNSPATWDLFGELERRLAQNWGSGELFPLMGDGFTPLADIYEADDAYVVELDLPGVTRGDIDIELAGRRLIVTGERKEKERTGILRRRTRRVGQFRFELLLPTELDNKKVDANFDDGVLTIRVPKAAAEKSRRIEVK
jgi:HSP20 family protein